MVDLTGGKSPTFTGTYTGSGTGRVQLASGTFTGSGAVLDFPSGLFVVSGGTLGGTVTNAGTGFITVTGGTLSGTLTNQGTIVQPSWHPDPQWQPEQRRHLRHRPGRHRDRHERVRHLHEYQRRHARADHECHRHAQEPVRQSGGDGGDNRGGRRPAHWSWAAAARAPAALTTLRTAGGAIDVAGADTSVWTGSYSGSGAGAVEVALGGAIAPGAAGATLDFTSELFRIAKGGLNLQADTLTNTGTITLINPANVTVQLYANNKYSGGTTFDLGGTLINTGTIVQQGAGSLEMYDNTILSNQGTYQFAVAGDILFGSAAPTRSSTRPRASSR